MTIGAALLLIAAGAILRFAISTTSTHGVNLHTIGDILMVVGVIGVIVWAIVWAPWARRRRTTYAAPPVDEEPPPAYRGERYTRPAEPPYDDRY
jgi:hypothetical protein